MAQHFQNTHASRSIGYAERLRRPDDSDAYSGYAEVLADTRTPETDLQEAERNAILRAAFGGLTKQHQVILFLRHVKDGKWHEIAAFLGITERGAMKLHETAATRMRMSLALMGVSRGDLC